MRDFIQFFLLCVEFFFILYIIGYASFLFLSVTVGASELYAAKRRNRLKNELENDYYVPVSIVVPAHNEEVTIESTIRSLLSLTAFFARIYTIDLKLYPSDVVKAVGLCAAEVSCLRFILAWVRMTALIGYRKKKHSWGRIERQKIEIK